MNAMTQNQPYSAPSNALRRRRLYFDLNRSRLFEGDCVYDVSELRDREICRMWCAVNDVDFFDHRIELVPAKLRRLLLRARAAGAGHVQRLRTQWTELPLKDVRIRVPKLRSVTTDSCQPRREASRPKRPRSRVMELGDDGIWRAI